MQSTALILSFATCVACTLTPRSPNRPGTEHETSVPLRAPKPAAASVGKRSSGAAGPFALTLGARSVDASAFYTGFPYSSFEPDLANNALYYVAQSHAGNHLHRIDGAQLSDLSLGQRLSDVDLSRRTFWEPHYNRELDGIVARSDENADENLRLWFYPSAASAPRILGASDGYLGRFSQTADGKRIVKVVRYGQRPEQRHCLEWFDTETERTDKLYCDTRQSQQKLYTWSETSISPDRNKVAFTMLRGDDRKKFELFYLDRQKKRPMRITPASGETTDLAPVHPWTDDNTLHFVSNRSGFANLYRFDLKSQRTTQLTHYDTDLQGVVPLTSRVETVKAETVFVAVQQHGFDSRLLVLSAKDGKLLYERRFDGEISIVTSKGPEFVLFQGNAREPQRYFRGRYAGSSSASGGELLTLEAYLSIPKEVLEQISRCNVERVKYASTDIDPATGKHWTIPALLFTPRTPTTDKTRRLFIVEAFYGGANRFNQLTQLDCALGITRLSPAVRGSYGYGMAYGAANDGANADAPVRDVVAGARFLEQKLEAKPHQIGTAGFSHGGWAAIRALSLPEGERGAGYGFGFALAGAGAYDLVRAHATVNIPGWVDISWGNPKTDLERLKNMSPLNYADRLNSPVFLYHGANDNRIPPEQSKLLHEKLIALGRRSTLLIVEGQGHGIAGQAAELDFYRKRYAFLKSLAGRR